MEQTIDNDWEGFKEIFKKQILPIYEKHEKDFDYFGFHGKRHITRSVIFSEIMARFYVSIIKESLDIKGIRLAVSFHDAGREGNGRDLWEKRSAELCFQYLMKNGEAENYARLISNSILRESNNKTAISQIALDADILEVMRLFTNTHSGFEKFRKKELLFLSDEDVFINKLSYEKLSYREQFIDEAWKFIYYTEKESTNLISQDLLDRYIYFIKEDRPDEFPLFSSLI